MQGNPPGYAARWRTIPAAACAHTYPHKAVLAAAAAAVRLFGTYSHLKSTLSVQKQVELERLLLLPLLLEKFASGASRSLGI
jgi:hypothetical protein